MRVEHNFRPHLQVKLSSSASSSFTSSSSLLHLVSIVSLFTLSSLPSSIFLLLSFHHFPLNFRGTPVSPDALLIGAPVLPPAATRLTSLLTTILLRVPTSYLYINTSYQSLRFEITGSGALDSSGIKSPVPQPTGVRGPRGQSGLSATLNYPVLFLSTRPILSNNPVFQLDNLKSLGYIHGQ